MDSGDPEVTHDEKEQRGDQADCQVDREQDAAGRGGGIRWRKRCVNVSTICIGEYVGLEETTASGTSTSGSSGSGDCWNGR